MESIAAYSPVPGLSKEFLGYLPQDIIDTVNLHALPSRASLEEFLKYEIPEIMILHMRDELDGYLPLLDKITQDPWLDSIALILIVDRITEEYTDKIKAFNVAYSMAEADVQKDLAKVFSIFHKSKNLLNHSELIKTLAPLSGELIIDNEVLQVHYFANFFSNFLYRKGYVSQEKKFACQISLTELLQNAIEHGNAEISYKEKTNYLEDHVSLQNLITERLSDPDKAGRTVSLQYTIAPLSTKFVIIDQGPGFDFSRYTKGALPDMDSFHGRGLFLAWSTLDHLQYKGRGNEVHFEIKHNGSAERVIPPGFSSQDAKVVAAGEVIFKENATSNSLYYIVSGEYQVIIAGKDIAVLSPEDIFLGEMSFLLGNKRSATVIAKTEGKLVEISRSSFTDAIKAYPNYGIFLSKLLARRLKEANQRYVGQSY
jgi:anti-sigma regulatory factor (Ser/Thr protein kinase)